MKNPLSGMTTMIDEFFWTELIQQDEKYAEELSNILQHFKDSPFLDAVVFYAVECQQRGLQLDLGKIMEIFNRDEEEEDLEDGDEWKLPPETATNDEDIIKEPLSYRLYRRASSMRSRYMEWFKVLPDDIVNSDTFTGMLMQSMKPAHHLFLAGSFGDDGKEQLAYRIAHYKLGLQQITITLSMLQDVRNEKLLSEDELYSYVRYATDLREATALMIIEVREQYYRS